jgi:cytidylate kinase
MHISISGKLGSGKSTVSNVLKENHGFEIYSTGAIQREIALRHKVSTLEMNQLMAQDLSFDHAIDDAVTKISVERKDETIVFDSRMAWRFAVNSYKVFVIVDPLVAASRVMGNQRGEVEIYNDLEEAKSKLIERGKLENERFIDIYGVDNFDYSNYNLVIDSTYSTPDELADIIYDRFKNYCNSSVDTPDILMAPASLYPLSGGGYVDLKTLEMQAEDKCLHSQTTITAFDGYHYVIDGQLHVLAAIMNKESFIDVKLVDTDKYPFCKSSQNLIPMIQADGLKFLRMYEEIGNFRYRSYPEYYS